MKLTRLLLLLFFANPFYSTAQFREKRKAPVPGKPKAPPDTGWEKVRPHIFRIVATQPLFPIYETNGILSFQYERKLANKIGGLVKVGDAFSTDNFGVDGDGRRAVFYFYAALEARYYYSHNRRVRKLRSILNNTGPYFGLEASLITNPFLRINDKPVNTFVGTLATHLNIGYQKQIGNFYFGGYFGPRLTGKRLTASPDYSVNSFHGGTFIGVAF